MPNRFMSPEETSRAIIGECNKADEKFNLEPGTAALYIANQLMAFNRFPSEDNIGNAKSE